MCTSEKCHGSKFSHSDSHFTQPLKWSIFRRMFEQKIHSQKSKPLTGWCRRHEMTWMLNNKVIHLRKCFMKSAAHFIPFPFNSISSQFFLHNDRSIDLIFNGNWIMTTNFTAQASTATIETQTELEQAELWASSKDRFWTQTGPESNKLVPKALILPNEIEKWLDLCIWPRRDF